MQPASRNIGAGASNVTTTDNVLNIDTRLGAATLTLPSITDWYNLKNKSGASFDADGLRFTDIGKDSATNNITFVAAAGDLVNGASSIVVNTNGASGILTPTLEDSGNSVWEFSLVGAASSSGTGEYDVFGTVLIDNIFVPSLDLAGLKIIYAPNYGSAQGEAIYINGAGGVTLTAVSMPDLTEVYGNITISNNSVLTSINEPLLTLVTDYIQISGNPLLTSLNISGLVSVDVGSTSGSININNNTALTTLDLSKLVFAPFGVLATGNTSLMSVLFGSSLFAPAIVFSGDALIQASVDDILAKTDAAGYSPNGVNYNTLVGKFSIGETVTGGTSGATAIVKADSGSLIVGNSTNYPTVFQVGETITGGTSGATAVSTGVISPAIDLSGGTNATPSASGLVHKSNLQAKGWQVTNN